MDYTIIKENDELFPKRLKEIKDYPKKIYAIGNLELLNKDSIAIVGARDCDNYGMEQAKRFSSYLAQKDICIVSGLAKGIDSIAHIHSMDKMGKTIAVIASGFNNIYPKENEKLFYSIIRNGGLIISEWEPDVGVNMQRFPRRNRIISGLSIGTLVVQSRYRSGSNITAHSAIKQRREVFCLPGNLGEPRSLGTNRLIKDGASIVLSPLDILEDLEYDGYKFKNNLKVLPEYKQTFECIGDVPISADEISRLTNKTISVVNEELLMLEMDGFIKSTIAGKYIIKEE